ncbi:MAG: HDOD domain-containing protein [Pseudomonadales bacterium]|nr:HDOD domain-containing protein [Pseudomonadales bacterium]
MSDIFSTVENEIISSIETDKLVLPTLPEVALRIREVAQDEAANVGDLTQVISSDTAISARIIKICNSPLLRASQPVENLKMAVNRLGMGYSADLATGLAMEQMFQATSDIIDSRMRELWSRNTEVAGICNVLAQNYTRLSPGQATLAGLTHKIGVLPILKFAEDNDHLLSDGFTLDEVIERLHPKLGWMILRAWDFSEDLCEVPLEYLNFSRESDRVDFVDIVTVANLQSYIGTDHPCTHLDWSLIPAFNRLGLDPSKDQEDDEDLSENFQAALAMLS